MARLLRVIVTTQLWCIDALPLLIRLLLFYVIVRTARNLLEVVALTPTNYLRAAHSGTRSVHILLLSARVRGRIAHILRALALPIKQIHLRTLPEAYLWQVLRRLRAIAAWQRLLCLSVILITTLWVVCAVRSFLIIQWKLVHFLLRWVIRWSGCDSQVGRGVHLLTLFWLVVYHASWTAQFPNKQNKYVSKVD